ASDGRRLNQLRSMAMLSERVGSVKSRTMPLAFAEPPPSPPAPPPPRLAQSPPLPSNGCGGPVMPARARIAAQTPHFADSALRVPFHMDSAPTPLFNATCGVK